MPYKKRCLRAEGIRGNDSVRVTILKKGQIRMLKQRNVCVEIRKAIQATLKINDLYRCRGVGLTWWPINYAYVCDPTVCSHLMLT